MPGLNKFRIERKLSTEKGRKYSLISNQKCPLQFFKLFQRADVNLPWQLQNFLVGEGRFPLNEMARGNANKVRIVLKINECRVTPSCLVVNKNQKCIGLIDPTPSRKTQTSNASVNLFPFDSILSDKDSPTSLFTDTLIEPILDFFRGRDSCLFSFGHSGLGKTKSMIGFDQLITNIGIIPCALAWTFKMIDFLKTNTNKCYSLCISATEVSSKSIARDLLQSYTGISKSTSMLKESKAKTMSSERREIPAGNLLKAAHILDAALLGRSKDNESATHLQIILHLHQYKPDQGDEPYNGSSNTKEMKGEKSRLYLLDLGSGRYGNEDQRCLSFQGISKVILALYASQRHIPYKENPLTTLLKETLNTNVSATMLLHVSSKEQNYAETLQAVQLAYKLYRMRLKKYRSVAFSISDETSSSSSLSSRLENRRLRPQMGIGATRRSNGNSSASSELDVTSASELSCCETVIYKGNPKKSLSDKSPCCSIDKKKTSSVSSDSDNVFSDKCSSKGLSISSGSPALTYAIRRHKSSPRTNARVWPTSNETPSLSLENRPELWVDGPNAIYKADKYGSNLNTHLNFSNSKIPISNTSVKFNNQNVTKLMISKETQCDDAWDSGSSINDGSSHSNTLERKDHRPLSDISECTEDTESNIAFESELIRIKLMDHLEPSNDLDDLFESGFELLPVPHESLICSNPSDKFKHVGQSIVNRPNEIQTQTPSLEIRVKSIGSNNLENVPKLELKQESIAHVEAVMEKEESKSRFCEEEKLQIKSKFDPNVSSASENRDRVNKSRCKKCSKTPRGNRSKSVSSAINSNFTRVASWIENVENEIKSSKSMKSDLPGKHYKSDESLRLSHYNSQPNISYQYELYKVFPNQYQLPSHLPYLSTDSQQPIYSLYDGNFVPFVNHQLWKPTSYLPCSNHVLPSKMSTMTTTPYMLHMISQPELIRSPCQQNSPKLVRLQTHFSNISLPVTSGSIHHLSLSHASESHRFFESKGQCEMNITNPLKRPPSVVMDKVPLSISKCQISSNDKPPKSTLACRATQNDIQLPQDGDSQKDKLKKESRKIMTILFGQFLNFRKKSVRKRSTSTMNSTHDQPTTTKSLKDPPEGNNDLHLPDWRLTVDRNVSESNTPLTNPYHIVTNPKTGVVSTESSGHGSDSSSLHNKEPMKSRPREPSRRYKTKSESMINNSKHFPRQRPTSSGYGSIIIKGDSELSSHNDSSSEYSLPGLNNSKVLGHGRLKHSASLSNYKSIPDQSSPIYSKNSSLEIRSPPQLLSNQDNLLKENVKIAEDLIIQEKLKVAMKEERRLVIQLIEANRLRGIPIDAGVMNLVCFKLVDSLSVTGPSKRSECEQLIEAVNQETELLRKQLTHAQHRLCLITSFDSRPQA